MSIKLRVGINSYYKHEIPLIWVWREVLKENKDISFRLGVSEQNENEFNKSREANDVHPLKVKSNLRETSLYS